MLTSNQIKEIREHLSRAQNPLFFFDNDVDGLCSYLLLRRFIGRGKGIAIKSYPGLNIGYARRITELNADYVFVLDKPEIDEEFMKKVQEIGVPFVWIDHHDMDVTGIVKKYGIYYFNPMNNKDKKNEPVCYLCYKIAKEKKQDMWIAMIGCIGDAYMPEFVPEFKKQYPELWGDVNTTLQAVYSTDIGKVVRILNFALKDRTSSVVRMLKTLVKTRTPHEILAEDKKNQIYQRFKQIDKRYQKYIKNAETIGKKSDKSLFFIYAGQFSLSADIANELFFKFPDKLIVVCYRNNEKINVSMRWKKDVRKLTLKVVKQIEGARGGGHKHATGATIPSEDLEKFKRLVQKEV